MTNALTELIDRPDAAKKLRALLDEMDGQSAEKNDTDLKNGVVRILSALLEGRNENTAAAYRLDMKMFAKWLGAPDVGTAVLAMLKCKQGPLNEMILRYRRELETAAASSATINHRLIALRECLKLGRQFGITMLSVEIKGLPAEKCKNMSGPPVEKVMEVLKNLGESRMPVHTRDRCLICLYFYCALRASEALKLDFEHVDLNRGVISILGKKRRMRQDITMPAPVIDALLDWLEVRGTAQGPLFIRMKTWTNQKNNRISRETVFRNLKGYGLKRIHALRHTSATAASKLGVNLQDIQALLRHASPATTARYLDNKEETAITTSRKLAQHYDLKIVRKG